MNRRKFGLQFGILALVAVLVGCGGEETEPAAGDQNAALGGDGKLTIAMIAKSSTNPFFLSARVGADAAAAELSASRGIPIEVLWLTPPQEDGQLQAQRIAQAVNEGADAILMSASDPGKVIGAINDAVARGVPVMTFDSDVPDSDRFAYFGLDNVKTGQSIMAELAVLMNGQGQIGILAGNQNAPNLQQRTQGVRDEAAKHPGISVAGVFHHPETPQDAAAEVIRVMNAYPEISGWAFVGAWPLFTTALLGELDPAQVKIVSVDGLPAQLAYVERGLVPILLAPPVYDLGYVGVKTIVERLLDDSPTEGIIPMELVRVTRDNLGDWARRLKEWGFTDVDPRFVEMESTADTAR